MKSLSVVMEHDERIIFLAFFDDGFPRAAMLYYR